MKKLTNLYISTILLSSLVSGSAFSAIALDRTRVIFNGDQKAFQLLLLIKITSYLIWLKGGLKIFKG